MENFTRAADDLTDYFGNTLWIVIHCTISFMAIFGNILTLFAITTSNQLSSTISNQFIFSLAISDLLVGSSIPYHMCFYMIQSLKRNQTTCVSRFVLVSFACASSILNLFFVATDRYTAIIHPLKYNRYMTREASAFLIGFAWLLSLATATVPIYWNVWLEDEECGVYIIPSTYFNFFLTPMFTTIWSVMFLVYIKILKEASRHAKRIQNSANFSNSVAINHTKSIQVVMLTLGCFSICWLPYFIVTTYFRISGSSSKFSLLYEIAFTMAVGNSGMNPVIYAWKNSNFREAFWCLLTCHSPNNVIKKDSYITNHVPSKKSSMVNGIDSSNRISTQNDIEMNRRRSKDYDEHECSVSTDVTSVSTTAWND